MRKKILASLTLIFSLFLVGSGFTIYSLVTTTDRLRSLIGLHEIEEIRQELFNSIQQASSYVFAPREVLQDHFNEILSNSEKMHSVIRSCSDCHHESEVQRQLDAARDLADRFEQELSTLITMEAQPDRLHRQQEEVYRASTAVLVTIQEMITRASESIDRKTVATMNELNRIYLLVGVTLLGTLLIALFIARRLTREITEPVEVLLDSARRITHGQWGYQADYQADREFQELITAFNRMSESLAIKREQEQLHLQKLQETQRQLVEAEKLSALGTLAGGIAHDFNNILCGMIGHLNILSRRITADEESLKTIRTIESAAFRAADLVKQLLTFARRKKLEPKILDLNSSLREVTSLIGTTLDKRVRLRLDLEEELPPVRADPSQVEQVIVNLCVNARDAMNGEGEIRISTSRYSPGEDFRARHHDARVDEYVVLSVSDTGCGINEKILPRIFDPFFTTKEVGKGTGLGLAMVYGIVKSHEGICEIESEPGRGTTVRVYLPAARGAAEASPASATPHSLPADSTILIVDDEPMVAEMLGFHLEREGCSVLTAANGREAVDILTEHRDRIDLIILDINMPVMGGLEAYRRFMEVAPEVPVLVATGNVMNEEAVQVLEMGARGYLQKPFRMEEITASIARVLQRSEKRK
ncbi:MAG: hypothetical protein Kow0089_13520 [Desulfobulbaceae bacterium]